MRNQGVNMYRKLLRAAAATLALAPITAQAKTLSFSFDTQDAALAVFAEVTISDTLNSLGGYDATGINGTVVGPHGETTTIGGLANSGRWGLRQHIVLHGLGCR